MVLLETRQHDRAGEAYRNALEKEPENLQALWGAAQVDMQKKQYDSAAQRLSELLSIDPQYKFGDVSLAYGKTLYELGNHDVAREHLEGHILRWRHPGSLFLLASLEHEQKNHNQAREHLHAMLQDINGKSQGDCPQIRRLEKQSEETAEKTAPLRIPASSLDISPGVKNFLKNFPD